MLRGLLLRLLFIKTWITRKNIIFKGWCVIHSFKGCKISIGSGTILNSCFSSNMLGLYQRCIIVARYGGKIEIGENCGISGSTIYSWDQIKIGGNTLIGANCKIIDNDFHPIEAEYRYLGLDKKYTRKASIEIGNDCFIGMNSIILKGTKLGDNVVVGAGSVVHGSFPDNCIIAGNPARIIKKM